MNKNVLRWIAVIITVMLASFALVIMLNYSKEFQQERESLAEIAEPVNDNLVRLMVKRGKLQQELEDMDEKIKLADDHMGSIVFLFTEPKKEVLTEIVPIMDKYDYDGVIAISARYYPGVEGCMNWEELESLTDKGWELCVNADDVADVDMLKAIFKKGDKDLPKTVYYPQNQCNAMAEQIWLSDGFENLIEYDGRVTDIEEDTLWRMAAYGSGLKDSQITTKSYYTESKPIVLTVGFENTRELFTKVNFEAMLSAINGYEKNGEADVTNVAGAKARYRIHLVNMKSNPEYSESDREAIVKQIEEIDRQIEKLREFEHE